MNRERFPNKTVATLATVLAIGGLAACGESEKEPHIVQSLEMPAAQPLPAGTKACNGLPPYRVTGRSKDGEPLLRFKAGVDCALFLYDEETLKDIPNSLVDQDSTFFACYEGKYMKPQRIEATLTFADHVGPSGDINLSDAASIQLATNHDIPNC